MKKIVIIGANDFQNQLIVSAKKKGIETHVFAWACGDIGEKTADFFYPISIIEKEQILEICKKILPDGVISIASDLAMVTVNYIAEKLNLTGNGIDNILQETNKYEMRRKFREQQDPIPQFALADFQIHETVTGWKYPLIVKPVDRSGSRGITKIYKADELDSAIKAAQEQSFLKQAIVEEYFTGKEYSVEYISYKGEHHFLAITQKYTTGSPHYIETGHMEPADIDQDLATKIKSIVEHALNTLHVQYGASHSEILVNDFGEICIVEIGARMGGDCIGSDLVKISTGYDFVSMVIDVALGNEPQFQQVCKPEIASIQFILCPDDIKKMNKIKNTYPDCIYRISKIESFDNRQVSESGNRYGYYIMHGRRVDED